MESKPVTQAKLDKLLAKWQKVLRLQNWEISIEPVNVIKENYNLMGQADIMATFREAKIQIRADLSGKSLEYTVVHELMHVVFGGMDPPDTGAYNYIFETGIEAMARILVDGANGKS